MDAGATVNRRTGLTFVRSTSEPDFKVGRVIHGEGTPKSIEIGADGQVTVAVGLNRLRDLRDREGQPTLDVLKLLELTVSVFRLQKQILRTYATGADHPKTVLVAGLAITGLSGW